MKVLLILEFCCRIQNLENMLFIYAKNNLAVVNIYIKVITGQEN